MRAHAFRDRIALIGPLLAVLALNGAPAVPGSRVAPRMHAAAVAAPDPPPRADTLRAVHLLRRATYGVRPEDMAEVLRIGADVWLDRQLHPERIDDRALDARLAAFPAAGMSIAELYRTYPPPRVLLATRPSRDSITPEMRRELARRSPRRIVADLIGARLQRAIHSERQLEEVMTEFWFNHFNVFFGKGQVQWLVSDYERTAIRPHVFGSFEEMLVATASHPAMLVYLDNSTSSVPDSANPAAIGRERLLDRLRSLPPERRDSLLRHRGITPERLERIEQAVRRAKKRPRGLNENYARELLELHTLGVDGGYTQQDVIDVARAFTGWTITRPRRTGGEGRMRDGGIANRAIRFVFRPEMHDRGEKVVLDRRLPAGRGREDGLDVLRMLARHPATARRIATKLARHFVADDPPPQLVDRLATTFLETGGDLREVTRALFTAEAFHDPAHYDAKVKRPFELVTSALRVTGADVDDSRALVRVLRELGELPYLEPAPTGYPATKEEWVSSGAMLNRMNFALALAAGRLDGVSPAAAKLRQRAARAGSRAELVAIVAAQLLPGTDTRELEAIVAADLQAQETSDPHALAARALGLILGSPEFQRR